MNYKIKRLDDPLYLPFAKNKLAQVDALRKEAGMFAMKKTYDFHGVRVIVEASDTGSSVSIITTTGFLYFTHHAYDFFIVKNDLDIIRTPVPVDPILYTLNIGSQYSKTEGKAQVIITVSYSWYQPLNPGDVTIYGSPHWPIYWNVISGNPNPPNPTSASTTGSSRRQSAATYTGGWMTTATKDSKTTQVFPGSVTPNLPPLALPPTIINNSQSFEAWIESEYLNSNAQMRPTYALEVRTNGMLGTEVNQEQTDPVYTINRSSIIYYDFKSSSRKFDILQEENQHLNLADNYVNVTYGINIVYGRLPFSIWYGIQHVNDNFIRAQNLLVRIATESLQYRVMTAADEEKRALKEMVFYLAISDGGSHEVRMFVSTVKLSFNIDMEKFVAGEIVSRDPVRMLDHLSGTRIQTPEVPFFRMYSDEEFYEEYRTLQGRTITPSPYYIICAPSGNRKSAKVVLIEEYKDEPDELKRYKVMQSGIRVTDTEYNKYEAEKFAEFLDEVNGLMNALLAR